MYEIPKNLNKYEDEFIPFIKWNFRQFIYFLILLGSIAAIYHFVKVNIIIKLSIIVPIGVISLVLIHIRFDERITSRLNLRNSLRDIGYYDPKMDKFIPISSIKDDTIYLKNGILLAIIEIKPIDFSILGDAEKEDVLFNYRGFLRSLDYPLQLCCRSAEVNLTEWLSNLKKIVVENNNNPTALERIESLTKWIEKEITESSTRNRLFYITVPYRDFSEQKSFIDSMKELFFSLLGKEVIFSGKRKKQYEKSLKEVSNREEELYEKVGKRMKNYLKEQEEKAKTKKQVVEEISEKTGTKKESREKVKDLSKQKWHLKKNLSEDDAKILKSLGYNESKNDVFNFYGKLVTVLGKIQGKETLQHLTYKYLYLQSFSQAQLEFRDKKTNMEADVMIPLPNGKRIFIEIQSSVQRKHEITSKISKLDDAADYWIIACKKNDLKYYDNIKSEKGYVCNFAQSVAVVHKLIRKNK